MTVAEIAETYHATPTTFQTERTTYSDKGLVCSKKRETSPGPAKVTGDIEA